MNLFLHYCVSLFVYIRPRVHITCICNYALYEVQNQSSQWKVSVAMQHKAGGRMSYFVTSNTT